MSFHISTKVARHPSCVMIRHSVRRRWWFAVLAALVFVNVESHALTYQLAGGNESWPADKRAAIVAAMDEAVALYNANGYFPKALTANYSAGVPTAQASYSGWIDFGGQIGTRTALHEISHTLGVGTYWNWAPKNNGGTWSGARATARVKIFDGAAAVVNCDDVHFWPYGLNFASEDGTTNRVRHIKMVAALRWDMGIVTDSDADGMPDDWEQFHFDGLAQTATGDWDADGVNNLAEYNADTNPGTASSFTWKSGAGAWDTATPNWTGASTVWRNGGNDVANFGGAAGVVTLAAGIGANDLSFTTTGYQLAGTALLMTGAKPTITTGSGVTATIAPALGGSGGLAKSGAGTLVLGGASNFTGPLSVNAGTLSIAAGGRLYMSGGAEGMTLKGGATLSFTGDWGWEGTMRYMGVQASENVIDGGTLQHSGASNAKSSGGAGRLFTVGAAGATLDSATAGAEFSIGYRSDYGEMLGSDGGTLTLSGAGDGDLNYSFSGTGGLVKRGAGLWKLTGTANNYSGGTTIGVSTGSGTVGGILRINRSNSLGTGPVSVIAGDPAGTHQGAQLQLSGGISLANPSVTISGLGYGAVNGVLLNLSGNNAIAGSVVLGSGAGGSVIASDSGTLTIGVGGITTNYVLRTLEFTGAGNIVVSGAISDGVTVALPLAKSGAGTLTLAGANTYSGATQIESGVLQIGAHGATGKLGSGPVTNDAKLRFHRSDDALVVANSIGGSGAVEFGVLSGGILSAETTLSGANTFTGGVTVNSGGVRITRSDALGTGAKTLTMTNGTNGNSRLILDGSGGNISLPAALSIVASNTNITFPSIINEAGDNTIAGNFSLTNGGGSTRVRVDSGTLTLSGQITPAVSGRTLQLDGPGSGSLTGALKNAASTVGLEKFGAGTWVLSGTGHTYTGATTILAGKLALAGSIASSVTASAGTFAPHGSAATSGGVSIAADGRLELRINGPTLGAQYDQLSVGGALTLAGNLDIVAGPGLAAGTTFLVVNKTSSGAATGIFFGKPQGSVFTASGYEWIISYTGGDGNDIALSIATPLESWRNQHFGTTASTGTAADLFDANGDGELNLMEFATAQNPSGTTRATPSLVRNGTLLELTYTRAVAALAGGVIFNVEWSDSLAAGSWSSAGVAETMLSDNGTIQAVKATVAAGAGRRFVRLRVEK